MVEAKNSVGLPINEQAVTSFYELREKIWSASSEVLRKEYPQYFFNYAEIDNISGIRKKILNDWYQKNMCLINDRNEYFQAMNDLFDEIKEFLNEKKFLANFHIFGSYANGVPNGIGSDLDFFVVLPSLNDSVVLSDEINKWEAFKELIVFSRKLGPFENLTDIYSTGNGLARLYSFSYSGIEVEFHVIGLNDVYNLPKLLPGNIKRVFPIKPKNELRTSFKGKREFIPKPADSVPNYILSNNDCFIGFFPLHIATSNLVYKGLPSADYVSNSFLALVKGFLFYNEGYFKNEVGRVIGINPFFLTDDGFLYFVDKVLYYNQVSSYSQEKLKQLRQQYFNAVDQIKKRYNLSQF